MTHAHHDHAGHAHPHHHAHESAPHSHAEARPEPGDAAFSLLRASALVRLSIATTAIVAVWAGVFWAMS